MAIVLRPDGTTATAYPKDVRNGFSLEELYALIGGDCDCIDVVRLFDGGLMVVDDEGRRKELPPNPKASLLYWTGRVGDKRYFIVGTVLIGSKREIQ